MQDLPPRYAPMLEDRLAIGNALVDTFASIHQVAYDAVHLSDLGRPAGYTARQVDRWAHQWQDSKTAEMPALDALYSGLRASLPDHCAKTIVHGDFRLDNTLLHPTIAGEFVAVLDWELGTLGDPLTDLGTLLMFLGRARRKRRDGNISDPCADHRTARLPDAATDSRNT